MALVIRAKLSLVGEWERGTVAGAVAGAFVDNADMKFRTRCAGAIVVPGPSVADV